MSSHDNRWKNQAGNKNRASYSLQEELPDILEALMECVSQENWKSLSRSAKPWDHLISPLFALKEEASLSDDVINKIWPIHSRVILEYYYCEPCRIVYSKALEGHKAVDVLHPSSIQLGLPKASLSENKRTAK